MANLVYPSESAVVAAVEKCGDVEEAAALLIRKFQPASEATKANIEEWRTGVKSLCEKAKAKQDAPQKPQSPSGDNKPIKPAKPEAPKQPEGGASGS